jgi:NADH-quinone oxidoreductase subunit J
MILWKILTLEIIYLFYLFIFLASIFIVSLNNPVQSILYLILVFIITSFLFILYDFTFLGLILMIVYLGAVVVLFLFIVMLLNIKVLELRRTINFYPFLFLIFSFFLFFLLINNFEITFFYKPNIKSFNLLSTDIIDINWSNFFFNKNSFFLLSQVMYIYFFLHFLIGGLVLFLAMIGAIVLTFSQLKYLKKQNVYIQLIRNRSSVFFAK